MITISKELQLPSDFASPLGLPPEELIFFDIETTGLSPSRSALYLIGAILYQEGKWRLLQWFVETLADERPLLDAFGKSLFGKKYLVHFNGDTFDLPYIRTCAAQYHWPDPFLSLESLDLFRRLRPLKKLLSLPRMRQRDLEETAGLFREDPFSGGELIQLYKQYLLSPTEETLHTLLLHNAEDLTGMLSLLPLLSLTPYLQQPFSCRESHIVTDGGVPTLLQWTLEAPSPPPLSLQFTRQNIRLCLQKATGRLALFIPLYKGELKGFYRAYKEYIYLPEEDIAYHKRVGLYVSSGYREKATPRTAYVRRQGLFHLQPSPLTDPDFRKNYEDTSHYAYLDWDTEKAALPEDAYCNTFLQQLLS